MARAATFLATFSKGSRLPFKVDAPRACSGNKKPDQSDRAKRSKMSRRRANVVASESEA
jgi:hypothetical protein